MSTPAAMAATEFQLSEIAQGLADLSERAHLHPIACRRAWDRGPERTSQRRMLQTIATSEFTSCEGGNRSGKTTAGLDYVVARALGKEHPDTVEWARINGVDTRQWRDGPGQIAVVALVHNYHVILHQPHIARLIRPYGPKWHNYANKGTARVEIPIPGYEYPATIHFLAQEQGTDAFQSMAFDHILVDEEGDSIQFLKECMARLTDYRGKLSLHFVPGLKGQSVYYDFLEKNGPPPGWKRVKLYSTDNPHIPLDKALQLGSSDAERAIRQRGEWLSLDGAVFADFSEQIHTYNPATWTTPAGRPVPRFTAEHRRFLGYDYGSTNPAAWVWLATGPDGICYAYRDWAKAGVTTGDQARAVTQHPETIELAWGPPEVGATLADFWQDFGIPIVVADNAVIWTIEQIAEALKPAKNGLPRLLISSACETLIRELKGYRRPSAEQMRKNPKERVVKRDDHTVDALRYVYGGIVKGGWNLG